MTVQFQPGDKERAVEAAAKAGWEETFPGEWKSPLSLPEQRDYRDSVRPIVTAALAEVAPLRAEVEALRETNARAEALAARWHKRGEHDHDMEYSNQVPVVVEDAIYESGVEFVERARHLRNGLRGDES